MNVAEPDYGALRNIDPPDWLTGDGRGIWTHVAPLLCREQILQPTDIHNLEMFCAAYGRFRAGEKEIAEKGVIVMGPQGGWVKNPAATIVNEAARQMATYGTMLGLDPASRQRLMGANKKPTGGALADILGM